MFRSIKTLYFILIGIFTLCYGRNFAQQDSILQKPKRNSFEIDFGVVHTRLIDEGFTQSKFLFRGTNPKMDFTYGHQNTQSSFNFYASATSGNIKTKQNELATEFVNIVSSIDYLRKLNIARSQKNESELFAGLQLSSKNYALLSSAIFDNIDLISLHGIYFKLLYQLKLDKKRSIQFTSSIPAIVYANRVLWNSGASVYTESDTKKVIKLLTTHGRYNYLDLLNDVQFNVAYKKQIGKSFDFTTRYAFRYVSNTIERQINLYSNEVAVGLKFNFK